MEIRPERFKVVAAKTLGKIYGYVKNLSGTNYNEKMLKRRKRLPCHFKKKDQLLELNEAVPKGSKELLKRCFKISICIKREASCSFEDRDVQRPGLWGWMTWRNICPLIGH